MNLPMEPSPQERLCSPGPSPTRASSMEDTVRVGIILGIIAAIMFGLGFAFLLFL